MNSDKEKAVGKPAAFFAFKFAEKKIKEKREKKEKKKKIKKYISHVQLHLETDVNSEPADKIVHSQLYRQLIIQHLPTG